MRRIYWSCFGSFSPSIRKPRTFHAGSVKLSKGERRKPDLAPFSRGSDGRAPRVHGRCSKGPVRFCRGEMALDVEGILDGAVTLSKEERRKPDFAAFFR